MEYRMLQNRKLATALGIVLVLVLATVWVRSESNPPENRKEAPAPSSTTVELTPSQLEAIKIAPVGRASFPLDKETLGSISFADDRSVAVFPPYQGKILKAWVELGDKVRKGQALYAIDSPDLIQAESNLISASGVFDLTSKELVRATDLRKTNGVSERELEQATSDQQAAEGALRAARNAVRVFGKTDAEMDQIVATRHIDAALVVSSPIDGQVTAFNAPAGLLAQPGIAPAPLTVSNVSIKWMLANVPEADSPLFHPGQPVTVRVMAYPDRIFQGKVSKIYESVDANTHRMTVRSEIADPKNELRPGMLADFVFRVQKPVESVAIPADGVFREGDGTMTAWVTTDRKHFSQRIIKTGMRTRDRVQILEGLQPGELAVTEGAVFLDNMLQAPPSD